MITERPILFSAPMVKAILEGKKTQTRRVVLPLPYDGVSAIEPRGGYSRPLQTYVYRNGDKAVYEMVRHRWPFEAKQQLWVRETWQPYRENSPEQQEAIRQSIARIQNGASKDIVAEVMNWPMPNGERKVLYAADFGDWAYDVDSDLKPWKPSIFMPRWASRITLEITDVRAERLQQITIEDIIAEGLSTTLREHDACCDLEEQWQQGWNKLNAKRGYGWDQNPWVWVIEFQKAKP